MIDTDKYEGHTEGKWTLEKVEQTDAEHEHYLLIGNNLLLSAIHHGGQEWGEHEANARLIADAPLLLQEVKRLREALTTLLNDCEMILDGDDMSGMSDQQLFGAMKSTILIGLGMIE